MERLLRWGYSLFVLVAGSAWLTYQRLCKKKYCRSYWQRLGLPLPFLHSKEPVTLWLHAVSVGELRAALPVIRLLLERDPALSFIVSTMTETAFDEAHALLPQAQLHFILPLDCSWTMRTLVRRFRPKVLLLSEGDLWYNMLFWAKKFGTATALINGKWSKRSARISARCPWLTRTLLSKIDLFCMQSNGYKRSLESLQIPKAKITTTGNTKCDFPCCHLTDAESAFWWKKLGVVPTSRLVVLGSSHDGEEELLLRAIEPLFDRWSDLVLCVVPRHPERFHAVRTLLASSSVPSWSYTTPPTTLQKGGIVLLDLMGQLTAVYQLASLAIVGGSFLPGIGGHNIFEPVLFGVPVLFGHYMEKQQAFVEVVLTEKCGLQIDGKELRSTIERLFIHEDERISLMTHAAQCVQNHSGAALRTVEALTAWMFD